MERTLVPFDRNSLHGAPLPNHRHLTYNTAIDMLDAMRLGTVLRLWRRMADKGVREVAAEIGISHGTLSRIERGEPMDGVTLAKLLLWLFEKETH